MIVKCVPLSLSFQVPWQGTGGNEKFFFENENVSLIIYRYFCQNKLFLVGWAGFFSCVCLLERRDV